MTLDKYYPVFLFLPATPVKAKIKHTGISIPSAFAAHLDLIQAISHISVPDRA
jgi:hypothetical protein